MAQASRHIIINGLPYILDERQDEFRSLSDPSQHIPCDQLDRQVYEYWSEQLRPLSGLRIVSADMAYDDRYGAPGWYPLFDLSDGTLLWLLSDEEGNGPGRFEIVRPE